MTDPETDQLPTEDAIQQWLREYGTTRQMMMDDTYYWPIADVLAAIKSLRRR